jgi:hypothetical protein
MLITGLIAEGLGHDGVTAAMAAHNAAVNNFLTQKEYSAFDKELSECKASGGNCTPIYDKYLAISNKNSRELRQMCTGGGIACVQHEELIQVYFHGAGKLIDPDALSTTQTLNSLDLQFLHENISETDRFLFGVLDNLPFSVLGVGLAGRNLAVNTKPALASAALLAGTDVAFQYFLTGEVQLSDLIAAGVIGAAFANPGAVTGRGLIYENPTTFVQSRVDTLLSQIPANSQGRITMGVAVVEDANGVRSVLVSTSEPRGYLRPGVTLQPGETVIAGTGHAEADIVSYANGKGLKIIDIGATRPVCTSCQNVIGPTGANISTPLKPPAKTNP